MARDFLRGSDVQASIRFQSHPIPGKRSLTQSLAGLAVQARTHGRAVEGPDPVARAAQGVAGAGGAYPFHDAIQASFGRHDLGDVRAHTGGEAALAADDLGAHAFAIGRDVAFGAAPDLHTAAHEAAHVIQQRAGVQLRDGVGRAGDDYERHADAVADRVVRGDSAEALLGDGPSDATRAPAVQLRPGHGNAPAEHHADASAVVDMLANRAGALGADQWRDLAQVASAVMADRTVHDGHTVSQRIEACFVDGHVSWESSTADQRAVFVALPVDRREPLRVALVKNSKLFDAITSMHLSPNRDPDTNRDEIERKRLDGTATGNTPDGTSVAGTLFSGEIAVSALVEPVRDRGVAAFANRPLAQWVHHAGEEAVVHKLYVLACGISSLFALSLSRGHAAGDPPSIADAANWLKGWTLDKRPGTGLLDSDGHGSPIYCPLRVVAAHSERRAARIKQPFELPETSGELGHQIERRLRGVTLAKQEQSRLAVVQGSGGTHTFFLYKDLDDAWRPMDVYLDLEDNADQANGMPGNYSTGITTLYFAIDNKR